MHLARQDGHRHRSVRRRVPVDGSLVVALLVASSVACAATSRAPREPAKQCTANDGGLSHERRGRGVIGFDEAHHEIHSVAEPRTAAFVAELRAAGHDVRAFRAPLDGGGLRDLDVLVIANPLHPDNVDNWRRPVRPAFTATEIRALSSWVAEGGALWLVADHMPFPGATATLAEAFGFRLVDGYAMLAHGDGFRGGGGIDLRRDRGDVTADPLVSDIEQIRLFGGHAFEVPAGARVLARMPETCVLLVPEVAGDFSEFERVECPRWPVVAVAEHGQGRVALFGEAAMLSHRDEGEPGQTRPVGFLHPAATGNRELLRRVAAWLVGDRSRTCVESAAR